MKSIVSKHSKVHFGTKGYAEINKYIQNKNYSQIFIIVDSNTHRHCLSTFLSKTLINEQNLEIIEFPPGEEFKTIDTCHQIWLALSELEADRKSLVINLGGGVVTDLGGFVACTFKRGIEYINVPTSLLAMVDASVGGKTGIDLGSLKNLVGIIANSLMVLIDTDFLDSLPQEHMKSGLAEMLKHGLIANRDYWNKLKSLNELNWNDLEQLIFESIVIKNTIVTEDPKENGIRKSLNFGHTLGHAIESYQLESNNKTTLLHGEAIAIGMVLEAFLSYKLNNLDKSDLWEIKNHIASIYGPVTFNEIDISLICNLMRHDKKNSHGQIKFALLERLGEPKLDCIANPQAIKEAFTYYAS